MINKVYDKVIKYIKENLWFLISLIIIVLLFFIELPYTVEIPGGFISLDNRIKIEGKSDTSGEMGMAYVSQLKGNIPVILLSYLIGDWDVKDKDEYRYENESYDDMEKRQKMFFNNAISNATYVAYTYANYVVNIKEDKLYVVYNENNDNPIKIGDNIISVDGKNISSFNELKSYIQTLNPNDKVDITLIRDEKELTINCSLMEKDNKTMLGVALLNNYEMDTIPKIEITSKKNESGSSGGLMMALAIYDKLTGANLNKNDKIIGTGTIDMNGNVGEIGGIKYKLIGAVNNGAKVFLCPKENYEEAARIAQEKKYDIIIKDVATFQEAVDFLKER